MIPVIGIFAAYFFPDQLPFLNAFAVNPYLSLVLAMALTYFPFGVLLLIKISKKKTGNVDPRAGTQQLMLSNATARNCSNCHNHMLEGYGFFAASVLAAMQAGVASSVVSQYATFWLIVRSAYVVIYIIQSSEAVAALRSWAFGVALGTQAKLFFLAVAAAQ